MIFVSPEDEEVHRGAKMKVCKVIAVMGALGLDPVSWRPWFGSLRSSEFNPTSSFVFRAIWVHWSNGSDRPHFGNSAGLEQSSCSCACFWRLPDNQLTIMSVTEHGQVGQALDMLGILSTSFLWLAALMGSPKQTLAMLGSLGLMVTPPIIFISLPPWATEFTSEGGFLLLSLNAAVFGPLGFLALIVAYRQAWRWYKVLVAIAALTAVLFLAQYWNAHRATQEVDVPWLSTGVLAASLLCQVLALLIREPTLRVGPAIDRS